MKPTATQSFAPNSLSVLRLLLCIVTILLIQSTAQAGYTRIKFVDNYRGTTVEAVVIYRSPDYSEAADTVENSRVGDLGSLTGFIGDRGVSWQYYQYFRSYYYYSGRNAVVIPTSYMNSNTPDSTVGQDLVASLFYLKYQLGMPTIFGRTEFTRFIIAGHGRGAAQALYASKYAEQFSSLDIKANILLAPSNLSATTFALAKRISQVTVIMAGDADCVSPISTNARRLYDSLTAACKTLSILPGGSHCNFADSCMACLQLEQGCSATLNNRVQQAFVLRLIENILDPFHSYAFQSSGIYNGNGYTYSTVESTLRTYPDLTLMVDKQNVCPGDTVTFTTNLVLPSYLWLPDSVRTPVYRKKIFSDAYVTLIVADPCYATKIYQSAYACQPTKLQIAQEVSICKGQSTELRVYNPGSYSSIRFSTGQQAASIYVSDSGYYYVRAVDPNCCTESVDSIHVKFKAAQKFQLLVDVLSTPCDSQKVVRISSFKAGNMVYKWNTGSQLADTTLRTDGMYTFWLRCTDTTTHCEYASDTVRYTLKSEAASFKIPTITQHNDTLISSPATFYNWRCNDKFIDGATNQSYVAMVPGKYSVLVIYDTLLQCNIESRDYIVLDNAISEQTDSSGLRFYHNHLYIDNPVVALPIRVYNLVGNCVYSSVTRDDDASINLELLNDGVYLVAYNHRWLKIAVRH